jgi:hypothetical protein
MLPSDFFRHDVVSFQEDVIGICLRDRQRAPTSRLRRSTIRRFRSISSGSARRSK